MPENLDLYVAPAVFFPADSGLPPLNHWGNLTTPSQADLAKSLASFVRRISSAIAALQKTVVIPSELWRVIAEANQPLEWLLLRIKTQNPTLLAIEDRRWGDPEVEVGKEGLLRGFRIYDHYFQVTRVKDLTPCELFAQAIQTCHLILMDLPLTLLGLNEILALLTAMREIILSFPQHEETSDGNTAEVEAGTNIMPIDHAKHTTADRDHTIATFRWLVGHHFFDLSAMWCGWSLLNAARAVEGHEAAMVVAENLRRATIFLRATTAAMWYAGNFPAHIYMTDVREQMISQEAPGGFSGTQNFDYEQMKECKAKLKSALKATYGKSAETWSKEQDPIYEAFLGFFEIDIEDNEHHILIAALLAGTQPSLFQDKAREEFQALLGDEALLIPHETALEMLRSMAQAKREEFAAFKRN